MCCWGIRSGRFWDGRCRAVWRGSWRRNWCGAGAAILAGPGAEAGAILGSGVGIGVGIGAGINYCEKECDEPKVLPFPKVEPIPESKPKDEDDCRMRLVKCLRFARTDPRRSEECMKAYEDCLDVAW